MWVRNAVWKPEFVMVYLNFPLERAVAFVPGGEVGGEGGGVGWKERKEAVLVEATKR
jgi:hypothetical protein